MEKNPKFIKEFSKEKSTEKRKETAKAIRSKRAEHFIEKHAQNERKKELQKATAERGSELAMRLDTLRDLQSEIEKLSSSKLKEVLNYFRLKKLRADVALGERTYEELKKQQDTDAAEVEWISEKSYLEETPRALQEAKEMLADFYQEQKEEWARSEYTKEDIVRYFSEEHLASISLDEYITLLRRFPKEMVTHVTRQGIRDHIGHMFHTAGQGVYTDGFMKIVEDGRLRSPLGVHLVEEDKDKAVATFLQLDKFKNKTEAESFLRYSLLRSGEPGDYTDRMAVHFAAGAVADCYYGSEKGNEVFIAYPSAYIASQYYFKGQLKDNSGGYWNDQWVWANEERGMDINAGVVFIPEEAKVNQKTGSRYELDEKKEPIVNQKHIDQIRLLTSSPDFEEFAEQVMKITGQFYQEFDDPKLDPKNAKLAKQLEPFRQRLETEFSIKDRRLQNAILQYHNIFNLKIYRRMEKEGKGDPFHSVDSEARNALTKFGILYEESKNPISSREFWEAYFAKRPDKRPSKIVYYKGQDPTDAFLQWLEKQGINKISSDGTMGFPERQIDTTAPQATSGRDRFKTIAERVIQKHFAEQKARKSKKKRQ